MGNPVTFSFNYGKPMGSPMTLSFNYGKPMGNPVKYPVTLQVNSPVKYSEMWKPVG